MLSSCIDTNISVVTPPVCVLWCFSCHETGGRSGGLHRVCGARNGEAISKNLSQSEGS